MNRVGVAELRQNLSKHLKRVEAGERLLVTDHNVPVAELGPLSNPQSLLDQLIAAGQVTAPKRRKLPAPMTIEGDPEAISQALSELREDR